MSHREKRRLRKPGVGNEENGRPRPADVQKSVPSGETPKRMRAGALLRLALFLLASAWIVLCFRAGQHLRAGKAAETAGRLSEAAREYESAVGYYAPFNRYSAAAGERMLELVRRTEQSDPAFSGEVRDRLVRSLRSTRWLVQPQSTLLAAVRDGSEGPLPRDPRTVPFLLSCIALAAGLSAWWLPLSGRLRLAAGAGGLAVWALLLYFC